MRRIVHMTSVHSQNDTRIFLKECQSLKEAGYDVSLIVQHNRDEVINGVKILALDKPSGRRERFYDTNRQMYKLALECNADIYHFHDPELIPIGLKLKRKGKKVIYDVHEDVPRQILSKEWIAKPIRKTIGFLTEKYENYCACRFDAITAATPHIRDRFKRLNSKTVDINNYPILQEWHMPQTDWMEKDNGVCYMGGITTVRGIYQMIDAIGMTDYKLLLGGDFESQEYRNNAVQMDGWSNVDELGYLNREQVRHTYQRSKAGLVVLWPIINYIDALPVKMFEYMSAGIPVIASDFPLWKEIIEGNECGLCVDPLNVTEIANAITWIMKHPTKAEQMGRNGCKAVAQKYNWDSERKKLIGLYEEVLL